jgi:hypothetical protein
LKTSNESGALFSEKRHCQIKMMMDLKEHERSASGFANPTSKPKAAHARARFKNPCAGHVLREKMWPAD